MESDYRNFVKTKILGTQITNATADSILKYIFSSIEKKQEKIQITTPNPEIIVYAATHSQFQSVLNRAQISLADGIGVMLAGKLLGTPLQERITGVDFMELLCKTGAQKPIIFGFLGAQPGVAEKAAKCLKEKYPGLKIGFADSHWYESTEKEVKEPIDILFVAFGFPKQEEWIAEHLPHIPVRVAISVGGAFDYLSGRVLRAPLLIRAIGLEWLFRLLMQPWRIKRQVALLHFVWLVFRERIMGKSRGDL